MNFISSPSGPLPDDTPLTPACREARKALHAEWDGDLDPTGAAALAAHLAECPACRVAAAGMAALRSDLSQLEPLPFPDRDLQQVWQQTLGHQPQTTPLPRRTSNHQPLPRRPSWLRGGLAAAAAAAAVMAMIFWAPQPPGPSAPPAPTPPEVARAEAQVRWVLGLTNRSLHHTQTVAGSTVSQTLRPQLSQIPVLKASFADSTPGRD